MCGTSSRRFACRRSSSHAPLCPDPGTTQRIESKEPRSSGCPNFAVSTPGSTTTPTRRRWRRRDGLSRASPTGPARSGCWQRFFFTDIVGSTELASRLGDAGWRELLQRHHAIVRQELGRYHGRELDTAGDGFFATFDGPARAVRAASAIRDSLRRLELEVRVGVHTGECEVSDGKLAGIAVSIGARISSLAAPGEVLVSSTVRDLVAGAGLRFEDRGEHQLKGVPDRWRLYAATSQPD
jgi:class 3 adenylate cyclase